MTDITFSQAIKQIEEINDWFDSDEFQLELAIEKYEQAQKLLLICQEKLSQAQIKFHDITPSESSDN